MNLTDLDIMELKNNISDMTGIERDKLRIRVDMNEKDETAYIVVVVDDKTTAEKIHKSINELQCHTSSSLYSSETAEYDY